MSEATGRVYGHTGQGERDAARVGILNRAAVFRSAPPPVPLATLCDCANGSNCVCHLTSREHVGGVPGLRIKTLVRRAWRSRLRFFFFRIKENCESLG